MPIRWPNKIWIQEITAKSTRIRPHKHPRPQNRSTYNKNRFELINQTGGEFLITKTKWGTEKVYRNVQGI